MKSSNTLINNVDFEDEHFNSDIINKQYYHSIHEENGTKIILEQWKTAVEFAKDLSLRRLSMNGLFITGLSIFLSGILFSEGLAELSYIQYTILSLIICVIGVVLCVLWVNQLNYYSSIISVKYDVIREMENYLPAQIFTYENDHFYSYNNDNKSFSKIEKRIPMVFGVVFLLIIVGIGVPALKNSCAHLI